MKPDYKEVLEDLREQNKEWAIVNMYDVKVLKEEDGKNFFFDITSYKDASWVEFGLFPDEMAMEAIQEYEFEDMKEINKEGYYNVTFLLKHSPADYFEGRMVERDYLYIVYTEAVFICTLEEREKEEKETEEMTNNFPFGNR